MNDLLFNQIVLFGRYDRLGKPAVERLLLRKDSGDRSNGQERGEEQMPKHDQGDCYCIEAWPNVIDVADEVEVRSEVYTVNS